MNHTIPPPEVINKQPTSFASDVWCIGVVLYYLVYRKYPFDAKIFPYVPLFDFQSKDDTQSFPPNDDLMKKSTHVGKIRRETSKLCFEMREIADY